MQSMDVEACSAELANVAAKAKAREREQSAEAEREKLRLEQEEREAQQAPREAVPAIKEESPEPPSLAAGKPVANGQQEVAAEPVAPQPAAELTSLAPTTADRPTLPPSPSLLSARKLSAAAAPFSPGQPRTPPPVADDPPSPPPPAEEPPAITDSTILGQSWAEVVATGEEEAEEVGREVSFAPGSSWHFSAVR